MPDPVKYQSFAVALPTPTMHRVGLSFPDLLNYAKKGIHLLQTTGDTFIDMLESGFRAFAGVTDRDLTAVLAAFAGVQKDVKVIIAAIQAEFGV